MMMHSLFIDVGWLFAAIAVAGTGYVALASALVGRFMQTPQKAAGHSSDVTILKPLYLGEPGLQENLESFFAQDFAAPVQIVFGVHDEADPAIACGAGAAGEISARSTPALSPSRAMYGANAKVSNLINMLPAATHDMLVLSRQRYRACPATGFTEVTGALARPGVGLVTCLYNGEAGGRRPVVRRWRRWAPPMISCPMS